MAKEIHRTMLMVVVLLAAVLSLGAQTSDRYALVIGNGSYTGLGELKNARNDATDMAAALKDLGFEVTNLLDADLIQMEEAVSRFSKQLSVLPNAIGLFYYAGHGVQSNGINYLIPTDARIPEESYLRLRSLPVPAILEDLQSAKNRLNIIILDACRDNPFSWARSGTRGLSVVSFQPPGSIIVYATSAGGTALEGTDRNAVFTGELLKNLRTPGIDVMEIFNRTGAAVQQVTNGKQNPAIYSQFFDKAYFAGSAAVSQAASPIAVSSAPPAAQPQFSKASSVPVTESITIHSANAPWDFFTLGSTKEEVIKVMGTPDGINVYQALGKEEWHYSYSKVTFNNKGVVTEWDDTSKVLKAFLGNAVASSTFTLGSTKEDVIKAMGTPDGINVYQALGKEEWHYSYSKVTFNNKGVVTEWDDTSRVLRLR
jgi:outer membrane protein assembly factor BamE (lipoprotein component of BamABCDE complex)